MKTAIMTDTNSGISVEEGEKLGVFVLPMPVLLRGEVYYEGVNISHEQFYQAMLDGESVTTSQPSPGDVLRLWDAILADCDELVYIPMSGGLSTSYQTACALAAEYGGRVQVVDHRSVSVPQRYAVLDAQRLAASGWSAERIRLALESAAADTMIYIGVDSLSYLKKGGRITPAAAKMGTLLQIKPLLEIGGGLLDACAKTKGKRACRELLLEKMHVRVNRCALSGAPLILGVSGSFTDEEDEAEWICMAQTAFPERQIHYDPLSLSIAAHVGPGAFGMSVSRRIEP